MSMVTQMAEQIKTGRIINSRRILARLSMSPAASGRLSKTPCRVGGIEIYNPNWRKTSRKLNFQYDVGSQEEKKHIVQFGVTDYFNSKSNGLFAR